jgi:hypothetical protein
MTKKIKKVNQLEELEVQAIQLPDDILQSDDDSSDDSIPDVLENIHNGPTLEMPADVMSMYDKLKDELKKEREEEKKLFVAQLEELKRNAISGVQGSSNTLFNNSSNNLSSHVASITYTIMTAPMLSDFKRYASELRQWLNMVLAGQMTVQARNNSITAEAKCMLCIYSRQFVEFEEVKDFSRNDINVVTKDWESYDHNLFIRFMKFSFQGIFDQESSMQIQ